MIQRILFNQITSQQISTYKMKQPYPCGSQDSGMNTANNLSAWAFLGNFARFLSVKVIVREELAWRPEVFGRSGIGWCYEIE